jgi:hypothetical protein
MQSIAETVAVPPAFFTAIHPAYHFNICISVALSFASVRFALAMILGRCGLIFMTVIFFPLVFYVSPSFSGQVHGHGRLQPHHG